MGAQPLLETTPRFVAYSDETNWNHGRYRAVAVVSMPVAVSHELGPPVAASLSREFAEAKWSKLKSNDRANCIVDGLKLILDAAATGDMRVDVVSWDIYDSRHDVPGRCDVANLGRMYHHAYRAVMLRWQTGLWHLHPDQHGQVDWDTLRRTAEAAARRDSSVPGLWHRSSRRHTVVELRERASTQSVFVQVADVLAGMSAYSREAFSHRQSLRDLRSGQTSLFAPTVKASARDRARWTLIDEFASRCKQLRMGVSLDTDGGLRTMNPANSVNFWWWTPQGSYDRAPLRSE